MTIDILIEIIRKRSNKMEIKIIEHGFTICKVKDFSKINFSSEYCFTGKTDEENSLVCRTEDVPDNATDRDDGWKAFRIQGILDFSLIGILAKISALLAENEIGIFVISTFNTDYVLVKSENYTKAVNVLAGAGYTVKM